MADNALVAVKPQNINSLSSLENFSGDLALWGFCNRVFERVIVLLRFMF